MSARAAAKARGGWWGLLEHMYTNGDYPFKMGRLVGTDVNGNKYYENLVDYPYGQHRWVEYKDIHNYDASQISPEWHGWMISQQDAPGDAASTEKFFASKVPHISQAVRSDAKELYPHGLGFRNELAPLVNGMHNQSQIRERGYKIGNSVVGIPPGFGDRYYKQPGSSYDGSGRFQQLKGTFHWDPNDPKSDISKLKELAAVVAQMQATAKTAGKNTSELDNIAADMARTLAEFSEKATKKEAEDKEAMYGGRVRSVWASDNSAKVAPGPEKKE